MITFAGALIVGATGAFFSDTETSTGNTFAAGALDLKVDSEAHYNGSICKPNLVTTDNLNDYTWQGGNEYPVGLPCVGTWAETDLGITHKFFDLSDIKPGDEGENTISLHVYNNDAWGRFLVNNVVDSDVSCTEPETEVGTQEPECTNVDAATTTPGELAESIVFNAWLDQGSTPGFQNIGADGQPIDANGELDGVQKPDPTEGDNLQQCNLQDEEDCPEPLFWTGETVDEVSEGPFNLSEILSAAHGLQGCQDLDGNTDYGICHGLAQDGRMVGSTTYYFGLGWSIPGSVGNEAQTDSLVADLSFQVEQHRNNPVQFDNN